MTRGVGRARMRPVLDRLGPEKLILDILYNGAPVAGALPPEGAAAFATGLGQVRRCAGRAEIGRIDYQP